MPVITVIVPVYNVEAYLNNSIRSILHQSFRELELLLIDDGSTDASLSICQSYSARDERVFVYHQENKGVSAARNLGLEKARGEFVLFVDSDDYIHEQMLEQLYALVQASGADIAICTAKRTRSLQECVTAPLQGESREYTQVAALQNLLCPQEVDFGVGIWNKLFRRRCLSGLRFNEELSMNEDKEFVNKVFCGVDKVVYTSQCLYFYYLRNSSITNSSDAKRWLECVGVSQSIYDKICDSYPELEPYARYQLIDTYYYIFNLLLIIGEYEEHKLLELKQRLAQLPLADLWKYLRLKQGIAVFLIKYLPLGIYKSFIPGIYRSYEKFKKYLRTRHSLE